MSKHFIQLRGVPGAGKTTVAKLIQSFDPMHIFIVATDDYWGPEGFDKERVDQAHDWCKKRVKENLEREVPLVIVHNTCTEYWEMEAFHKMARDHDYMYHRLIVEDHHGSGSTKDAVDEGLRDYMERKFQVRLKTP